MKAFQKMTSAVLCLLGWRMARSIHLLTVFYCQPLYSASALGYFSCWLCLHAYPLPPFTGMYVVSLRIRFFSYFIYAYIASPSTVASSPDKYLLQHPNKYLLIELVTDSIKQKLTSCGQLVKSTLHSVLNNLQTLPCSFVYALPTVAFLPQCQSMWPCDPQSLNSYLLALERKSLPPSGL
jgi:hypothetical protein